MSSIYDNTEPSSDIPPLISGPLNDVIPLVKQPPPTRKRSASVEWENKGRRKEIVAPQTNKPGEDVSSEEEFDVSLLVSSAEDIPSLLEEVIEDGEKEAELTKQVYYKSFLFSSFLFSSLFF